MTHPIYSERRERSGATPSLESAAVRDGYWTTSHMATSVMIEAPASSGVSLAEPTEASTTTAVETASSRVPRISTARENAPGVSPTMSSQVLG